MLANKTTRVILIVFLVAVGGLLLIQLVPYGRNHTNPPVTSEPSWDSPQTRELVRQACYDCHSNETNWPWYSNIAPGSWLVQHDVDEARMNLNFSEWDPAAGTEFVNEISGVVMSGKMPPIQFKLLHPEARLNQTQKEQLAQGIKNSLSHP